MVFVSTTGKSDTPYTTGGIRKIPKANGENPSVLIYAALTFVKG
jgi:hypothetical protein